MQVLEGGLGNAPDRALSNFSKHCVSKLVEQRSAYPSNSICERKRREMKGDVASELMIKD